MIEQHPILSDGTIPNFDQTATGIITAFGRRRGELNFLHRRRHYTIFI